MSGEESIMRRLGRMEAVLVRLARLVETGTQARNSDDDGWTRLPRPKMRCAVSGWSRSTVMVKIKAGAVRTKMVQGARYYAAKDVSELINS